MEGQSNGGWLSLGRRIEKCCHTGILKGQLAALVDEAWAAQVRTMGNAVLLAEIAQHHAHDWPAIGESDGLIDPACYDLEASRPTVV
jgi:hypothetical protein